MVYGPTMISEAHMMATRDRVIISRLLSFQRLPRHEL